MILSPEVENLKQECSLLRDELAGLFAEKDHLLNTVANNIMAVYATTIGPKEYEALSLDIEVRRLKATIENIQAIENQGHKANLEQIEAHVENELREWNKKVDNMLKNINNSKLMLDNLMSPEESYEFQKLYRSLAKKLHPDLNPHQPEEHKAIWLRVQLAYNTSDTNELRALQLLVDNVPGEIEETSQVDELQAYHTRLKEQISDLIVKIDKIKSEPPFTLKEKLDDPEWVEQQISECEQRIGLLNTEKERLEEWLKVWKGKK
jgi:uncharacterized small protein (DUF1192 family)